MSTRICLGISIVLTMLYLGACKHEPQYALNISDTASYGNFPDSIGEIIVSRCATAGCHNDKSYENAAGLRLDTWEHLFNGGNSGAVVIPYSPESSSLLFFINTYDSLGLKAQPQMPLNSTTLSKEEYLAIKNWIAAGAPDKNGNIPFASNSSNRQKIYIVNQGCDVVSVIDAEKKVVMRNIRVGKSLNFESAHYIKVSGNYAYVSFASGTLIQKIDTRTDKVVAEVEIGVGSWNAFNISDDGKKILLSDYSGAGRLILINAESMTVESILGGLPLFYPHGVASNASFDTFYVTSQYGNIVYKFELNGFELQQLSIDGDPPNRSSKRNPHEILMAPDRSKYFLTCDASNEVRVMDTKTDKVIDSIKVGTYPQTIALSKTKPYLFVTCSEDNSSLSGFRGSVYVINYLTNKLVQRLDGPFFQPHGISIDDRNGIVYISSRNIDVNGPAPHHSSFCGGRNGYYVAYDLNTLQKLPKRYEISVDPYSSDVRFSR